MPLPQVDGWLIDFRTALSIFRSQSNLRIAHCVGLCRNGQLSISHQEEKLFKEDAVLRGPFIDEQYRVYEPDDDVFERCQVVAQNATGKKLLRGNDAAIYITATAAAKNLGVISDHIAPRFATVHDFCNLYGVPVLTSTEYFNFI